MLIGMRCRRGPLRIVEPGIFFQLEFFPHEELDLPKVFLLASRHERERIAFRRSPPGPTDPVNIIFCKGRRIEVDHVRDSFHVDASRGDIGGYEDLEVAVLEPASARCRCACVLFEWIATEVIPFRSRRWEILSAPCLVLEKTSTLSIWLVSRI